MDKFKIIKDLIEQMDWVDLSEVRSIVDAHEKYLIEREKYGHKCSICERILIVPDDHVPFVCGFCLAKEDE